MVPGSYPTLMHSWRSVEDGPEHSKAVGVPFLPDEGLPRERLDALPRKAAGPVQGGQSQGIHLHKYKYIYVCQYLYVCINVHFMYIYIYL